MSDARKMLISKIINALLIAAGTIAQIIFGGQ